MDEQRLGEAIAKAINDANAKMLPEFATAMTQVIGSAQTGVFVEVASAEMSKRLSERATQQRARAEEIASAPSEVQDAPPYQNLPPFLREEAERRSAMATSDEGQAAEAARRAHKEQMLRRETESRRVRIEALRMNAERLDFMAAHLPKDQVFRLDRRELDDLFFDDRHVTAGLY